MPRTRGRAGVPVAILSWTLSSCSETSACSARSRASSCASCFAVWRVRVRRSLSLHSGGNLSLQLRDLALQLILPDIEVRQRGGGDLPRGVADIADVGVCDGLRERSCASAALVEVASIWMSWFVGAVTLTIFFN